MATFTNLLTTLRRDVVGEDSFTGSWQDDELLAMLKEVSVSIGSQMSIPRKTDGRGSILTGADSITSPTDFHEVFAVTLEGRMLELVDYATLQRRRNFNSTGRPKYYWHDPSVGGDVQIAPTADQGYTDIYFEYAETHDPTTLLDSDEPWDGTWKDFHWIVPLRTGVRLWEAVGEFQVAQHYAARYNEGMQTFAARLGLTNVARLMIQPEQRDDDGSKRE